MSFNLATADKISAKANRVRSAQSYLDDMRKKLAHVNRAAKIQGDKPIKINVAYEMGDTYGNGRKSVEAFVSMAVVQQATIYEVMAAERALTAAENSPL